MREKNQIIIRPATIDDVLIIADVRDDAIRNVRHDSCDQSALDEWGGLVEDRVRKLLSNCADVRIVAEREDKIIGYGELVTTDNLLGACYVSSSAGGRGVGKALVAELERIAREKGLDHLRMESSANAEKFYVHCGYHVVGRGKHTMRSGTAMDCVMMRKDLSE